MVQQMVRDLEMTRNALLRVGIEIPRASEPLPDCGVHYRPVTRYWRARLWHDMAYVTAEALATLERELRQLLVESRYIRLILTDLVACSANDADHDDNAKDVGKNRIRNVNEIQAIAKQNPVHPLNACRNAQHHNDGAEPHWTHFEVRCHAVIPQLGEGGYLVSAPEPGQVAFVP